MAVYFLVCVLCVWYMNMYTYMCRFTLFLYTSKGQKRILNIFLYCCPHFLENKCLIELNLTDFNWAFPPENSQNPLFSDPYRLL